MTRLYLADKSALEQRWHSNGVRDLLTLLLAVNALAPHGQKPGARAPLMAF